MEALDILEKRIDSLTRMLGTMPEQGGGNTAVPETAENMVDSLLTAQTLLFDAISGREHIKNTVNRSNELEKYLDPNFLEENQQVHSKEVYLNAIAPDLHSQFEQLEQVKRLEPTLGAEYFRSIPSECTDKLKQHAEDNGEFAQQTELIEESLIMAMKRYGEIQTGLLESLNAMSKRLEAVEDKIQQKKRDDLNADLPVKEETTKE